MPEAIITVDGLTRRFGNFTAVDRVNFAVAPGEIFGYLGANGAGKSTTIRMLCGLLAPSAGVAMVAGHDVGVDPVAVKRSIGYMSQKFSLYLDLTVEENLGFFAGAYGMRGKHRRERIATALELADLADRRGVRTSDLAGGIRQRLALASALMHEPRILFLDEPTAGVDPVARRGFWRVIRELARGGTTLFVTTHHLDEAEYCDRVGLMVSGRLEALDTPAGLKRDIVPGTHYAVDGAISASELATDVPALERVNPFGQRIHVRMRGDMEDPAAFAALLAARKLSSLGFEVIEPSLEDVFLELVGEQG